MLAPFTMTNVGLHIQPVLASSTGSIPEVVLESETVLAGLQCDILTSDGWMSLGIKLQHIQRAFCWVAGKKCEAYRRVECDKWTVLNNFNGCPYRDLLVLEGRQYELMKTSMSEHDERWEERKRVIARSDTRDEKSKKKGQFWRCKHFCGKS